MPKLAKMGGVQKNVPGAKNSIFPNLQITTTDLKQLMTLLCEFQDVYSQHCYDFSLNDIPFHITLKPHAELKKQRKTKIPIHYKEKNSRNS